MLRSKFTDKKERKNWTQELRTFRLAEGTSAGSHHHERKKKGSRGRVSAAKLKEARARGELQSFVSSLTASKVVKLGRETSRAVHPELASTRGSKLLWNQIKKSREEGVGTCATEKAIVYGKKRKSNGSKGIGRWRGRKSDSFKKRFPSISRERSRETGQRPRNLKKKRQI